MVGEFLPPFLHETSTSEIKEEKEEEEAEEEEALDANFCHIGLIVFALTL